MSLPTNVILQNITEAILEAAQVAGAFLLQSQKEIASIEVQIKSLNQLVSEIDINAEKTNCTNP